MDPPFLPKLIKAIKKEFDMQFSVFEIKSDQHFAEFEIKFDQKLDQRFAEFEIKLDRTLNQRFAEFETKLDRRLSLLEEQSKAAYDAVIYLMNNFGVFQKDFFDLRDEVRNVKIEVEDLQEKIT